MRPPGGVFLIALPSTFVSTCVSWSLSARIAYRRSCRLKGQVQVRAFEGVNAVAREHELTEVGLALRKLDPVDSRDHRRDPLHERQRPRLPDPHAGDVDASLTTCTSCVDGAWA